MALTNKQSTAVNGMVRVYRYAVNSYLNGIATALFYLFASRVMTLTQTLQRATPKKSHVISMRNDVVGYGGKRQFVLTQAVHAQRLAPELRLSLSLPSLRAVQRAHSSFLTNKHI
jgi:hypothetical protein